MPELYLAEYEFSDSDPYFSYQFDMQVDEFLAKIDEMLEGQDKLKPLDLN